MKIAIVSPLATVAPHFETEMEIAQRHIDQGDEVKLLSCEDGLGGCDFNAEGQLARCDQCVGRRWMGIDQLTGPVQCARLMPIPLSPSLPDECWQSVQKLCEFRVGPFDVGYAVVSSLVSIIRDPQPDLSKHRELVLRLYRAAMITYARTQEFCGAWRPDRVYVFNGRFAATRAVLRACQASSVECWIHERGCDTHHFQVFVNRLPHDIEYMQQRMRQAWNDAVEKPDRDRIAATWFTDRVARVERNWHSFVKHQSLGRLPRNWNSGLRNVSIFTSSEDEFVSIGESWRNPLYENQVEALRQIIADLASLANPPHLYVRIHPNLRTVNNDYSRQLLDLKAPFATVIPPNDPTDSYELLKQSDQIVTFGSSIGIEAVFWDKPSILLGPCFYQGFVGIRQPKSHREAVELISAALPPSSDKSGALMYGYWFQTHGQRFKYFEPRGLFEGLFKGRSLYGQRRRSSLSRMMTRVRQWLRPAA